MLFGESTSAAEAHVLLHTAAELGVNFFDSAEMYPVPQRGKHAGPVRGHTGGMAQKTAQVQGSPLIELGHQNAPGQLCLHPHS